MKNMNQDEYLELCQRLADEYYNSDEVEQPIPEEAWIPAESPTKEKLRQMLNQNGVVDLTKATSSQVLNRIHTSNNFKVGSFLVKITKYKGTPEEGVNVDLILYEEKLVRNKFFKDSKISVKVNPLKDMRFSSRNWAGYFGSIANVAKDIPLNTIPEVIRWLQAVQKMKAFL